MKDFIVAVALIVLGLALGGIILGFKSQAETMGESATSQMSGFINSLG